MPARPEELAGSWSPSLRQQEREAFVRRRRRQSVVVASVATVLLLGFLVAGVLAAPGWDRVRETFFSWYHAKASFPAIAEGFLLNVKLFLLAEPLILVLGVVVAMARSTTAAVLFPVRAVAVFYTDLFRGLPTLLVVYLICFGVPALQLQGVTSDLFWLALVALVLSYGAYVAEVIRAGIESIHPSQLASAAALGLSPAATMRHVVLPQAVRRVVPPLLNDFVSLQKDTALVASVALFDALFAARDYGNYNFNYTPILVAAVFFVALTIPLARFTDWLARRASRRERAGFVA